MSYICECGAEFDSNQRQKFIAHMGHCKTHLTLKGEYENYLLRQKKSFKKANDIRLQNLKQEKESKLQQWIDEKHTCEVCGKIMTELYGTGRFCSSKCAHARKQTEETKNKIHESRQAYLIKTEELRQEVQSQKEQDYLKSPSYCATCHSILPYKYRNYKTCPNNDTCMKQWMSLQMGNRIHQCLNKYSYKYGTYKGIPCDSSWELAYVMYHLDNNIEIQRNSNHFEYIDSKGKLRDYYPDFIVNNSYIEIKGFYGDDTLLKIQCVIDAGEHIEIIDKKGIKPYLNYCEKTYGKDFYTLYDKDFPSWMDLIN